MHQYRISKMALAQFRNLGFAMESTIELAQIVAQSAPFTSPQGNRRYEGLVMKVKDGVVQSVEEIRLEKENNYCS